MGRTDIEEIDYEKDLSIDPNSLDKEFVNHPIRHMRYAKLAAKADARAKRKEEKVKVIRSEIVIEIMKEGGKPTGPVIEARYRIDPRHKEAKREYIKAEENAKLLNEAVSAMRARRGSLENLAQLLQSGYFSFPKAPEGSGIGSDEALHHGTKETIKKKLKARKEA